MASRKKISPTWNPFNGELFGEMIFHDIADEYRDTYVIGFTRQLESQEFSLTSYYINPAERRQKNVHHFPQKLSELQQAARTDPAIENFVRLLNDHLSQRLIGAGMDSLAAYALLHNHPRLQKLISKPLVLMAAYTRLYRFEKLNIRNVDRYEEWFPKLFFRDKLSKGVYRALSRIDTSNAQETVSAAEYLIRNFTNLGPMLRGSGTLYPDAVRHAVFKARQHPELVNARWFLIGNFNGKHDCQQAAVLYTHTRDLMIEAGVTDWRRTLLHQVTSIAQLQRLHDRYIPRTFTLPDVPPDATFPTFGLKDNAHFKLIKTVQELSDVAQTFHNCVSIFTRPALCGQLMHILYERGHERGLLQIVTSDPTNPHIAEFKQPCNQEMSPAAWAAAESWLQSLTLEEPTFEQDWRGKPPPSHLREPQAPYHLEPHRRPPASLGYPQAA